MNTMQQNQDLTENIVAAWSTEPEMTFFRRLQNRIIDILWKKFDDLQETYRSLEMHNHTILMRSGAALLRTACAGSKIPDSLVRLCDDERKKLEELVNSGPCQFDINRLHFLSSCAKHGLLHDAGRHLLGNASVQHWQAVSGHLNLAADKNNPVKKASIYDSLILLAENWLNWQESRSHQTLFAFCQTVYRDMPYSVLCRQHRLMGLFSCFADSFKDVARDIILQHLFRGSYLNSSLRNDPCPFFEQLFLAFHLLPDASFRQFGTLLFRRYLENRLQFGTFTEFSTEIIELSRLLAILEYVSPQSSSHDNRIQGGNNGLSVACHSSASILGDVTATNDFDDTVCQDFPYVTYSKTQIMKGCLFILPDKNWAGRHRNDHYLTGEIKQKGAAAVLLGESRGDESTEIPAIKVGNSFTAMVKLAEARRALYTGRLIGITGSVGKTSTVTMLHEILQNFGKSYKNIPQFNHEPGLVQSIANIPPTGDFAIIEMGMGKPRSILPKAMLARPHCVIITDIQPDHMEFHDSLDSIISTKMEIIDGLEDNGAVILNRDSSHFAAMFGIAKSRHKDNIITFGEHPLADVTTTSVTLLPGCSKVIAEIKGRQVRYTIPMPGIHMVRNSLAVWAALCHVGIDPDKASRFFEQIRPAAGRNELQTFRLQGGGAITIINDSFNANPASMRSCIHLLSILQPKGEGRRIMVMGEMGELGRSSREYHIALADPVNCSPIDILYTIGDDCRDLHPQLSREKVTCHFDNAHELFEAVIRDLRDGDVIAFKGSARKKVVARVLKLLRESLREISSG